MSLIDIVIVILLIWAAVRGFRQGLARQLCGLAGVILGIWLGFRFGVPVGEWLTMKGETARIVGFIAVVVVSVALFAFIGWSLGKLIKFATLGMIDTIGGVLLSTFKVLIIISVLLVCFDVANNQWRMVKPSRLANSKLYAPVMDLSSKVFPVIDKARQKLF